MSRTTLPELSTFIVIAERLNFSVAARELGISSSALSHSVRKLEERLGLQLFTRTTRSVALTEAGKKLYHRAAPALGDLESAINELVSSQERPYGTIRISSAEAGARPLIEGMLPEFTDRYPDIHIEFVIDTRFIDIVADGFSAGIRLVEDVPLDMVAIPFGPAIRFTAVASPGYLSQRKPPKTPDDLHHHRCIRFRFSSGALYHWELHNRGRSVTVNVDGPMTLGNTGLMVDAALSGIGIAWVPDTHVREHLKAGTLIQVLPDWNLQMSQLCLYYPVNRHQPLAFRIFSKSLRAWASRYSPTSSAMPGDQTAGQ